jgi:hypothetical protein
MLDVLVAEVGLQRPGVHSVVGKFEAASVTKHVWVGLDLKANHTSRAFEHPGQT